MGFSTSDVGNKEVASLRPYTEDNKSNAGDIGEPEYDPQKAREQELLDQMKTEKHYYKLADYFVTIGLDSYATPDEVYKVDESVKQRESASGSEATGVTASAKDDASTTVDPSLARRSTNKELANLVEDFKVIEDEENGPGWGKIVKSLEIFVI